MSVLSQDQSLGQPSIGHCTRLHDNQIGTSDEPQGCHPLTQASSRDRVELTSVSEFITTHQRYFLGISNAGWQTSEMCLIALAYYIRDWKYLQIVAACLTLPFLLFFWIGIESPKWLISQKKYEDAKTAIKKFAKMQGKEVPESSLQIPEEEKDNNENVQKKLTPFDLFRTPKVRFRMILISCLGKYLKGSGAKSILVESSVFGVNVVEAVLSGKHYVRSIKGMQLLKEALLRLQLEAFFKQCDLTKYADELDLLVKMKAKVADKNPQDSQSLLRQFQAHSDSLLTGFDQFIEENRMIEKVTGPCRYKVYRAYCHSLNTRKQSHQHRAIEIARARGKSMEDLLQYDVRTSSYLFDSEGMMKKAVKSSLVQELEKTLTKEDTGQTPSLTDNVQTAYIVDMMANVRKMRTKGMGTFGAFCEATFIYIQNAAKRANRIDLIFDSYIDKSIKDSERGRRQTVAPIELNMINQETPLPVEMERFWSSNKNKEKLQLLLHEYVIAEATVSSKNVQIVASHVFGEQTILCLSAHNNCSTEVPELCLDIEEADARIIPHVLHAVQHGMRRIVVLSSDTDVSILLIYYWATFLSNGLQELWVKAGVGDSTRFIPIHTLASRLGSALCHVLPAVHMLTGCDYTSKVGTKQAALNNHPETYLKGFGTCANVQDMDLVIIRAEEYLVHVFKKGTAFTTMNQLRTHTYHQSKGAYLDKLPPTSYAIKAHIRRAFYGTHQMTTILSSKRHTLDATQYGYEEDDDMLMPAMAIREIPEEYTLQCNCQKCGTIRCVCRQK
ncbi:Solute carrier family 22 member 2 [Nymphon striatum]|nr:Solute carrier family 22 member 2 [Nymphon striatum]